MNSQHHVHPEEKILEQLYTNALTLRDHGDYAKALTVVETVLQAAPEWEGAMQLKADLLLDLGCTEEALAVYRTLLRAHPQAQQARARFIEMVAQQRAETLIRTQGNIEFAPALARRFAPEAPWPAAEKEPPRSVVQALAEKFLDEAFALDEQGAKDEAIALATLVLRLTPDHADACNLLGTLYEDIGQPAQALKWYQEAVKRDPEFREAQENLAALRETLSKEPWVTIARFFSLPEAEVARARLEVEGIPALVANRALANYFGAVVLADPFQLKVPESQVAMACDILDITLEADDDEAETAPA